MAESYLIPIKYIKREKDYLHPMKTYIMITLFIIGMMTALWFVMGVGPGAQGSIPPVFGFGPSDLYFHSIAIAMAVLLVYFVIMEFDLEKYEPDVDFPIAYRAMMATILGAFGGILYLSPIFNAAIAPIPLAIMFVALLFLADVGGALLVQMYLLPAKLTGRYDPKRNIMGMIPRWSDLPKWSDLKKMSLTYHLTFTTIVVAFIAGIIGFVVMWLNYFTITVGVSPTIFNGYISWIGGAAAMLGYTLGSHSHVMGMAIILGVVAIVASKFGVLEMGGLKSRVAKFGMLVSIAGLIVMVVVYLLEGFTPIWPNSTPPLLFASNPSGFQLWSATDANGMAGDDSTMFLASIGAMIILIPLLLTKAKGKSVWKDPLRLSVMATWILAFIATPIEGFFIEFNEATMQGGPTDIVFGNIQYFALFGITMIAMAFLAVDFFQDKARVRKAIAITGISVIVFTLISGFVYAYMDPGVPNSNGTLSMTNSGWLYSIGLLLMSFVILGALAALYVAPDIKISPPPEAKKPFRLHFPLRHKHLISG